MKDTIRYGLILGSICFLAGFILALTQGFTISKIKAQEIERETQALNEVLNEAERFEPVYSENVLLYYKAYNKEKDLIGYVIKTKTYGYASEIEIMAGLDKDLKIKKVKILSQNETPGLGSRITEESFLNRFIGRELKDLDSVDTITSATISSSAVIRRLKEEIKKLEELLAHGS